MMHQKIEHLCFSYDTVELFKNYKVGIKYFSILLMFCYKFYKNTVLKTLLPIQEWLGSDQEVFVRV